MHRIWDFVVCLPFPVDKTTSKKGFHSEALRYLNCICHTRPQYQKTSLQSYIRITSIQSADPITKQCQVPREPEALLSQVSETPQLQPLQQPLFLLCPLPVFFLPVISSQTIHKTSRNRQQTNLTNMHKR